MRVNSDKLLFMLFCFGWKYTFLLLQSGCDLMISCISSGCILSQDSFGLHPGVFASLGYSGDTKRVNLSMYPETVWNISRWQFITVPIDANSIAELCNLGYVLCSLLCVSPVSIPLNIAVRWHHFWFSHETCNWGGVEKYLSILYIYGRGI